MKMAVFLPLCMLAGSGIFGLILLAAKYLPDWAYFSLFLVVLPAIIGMFIDYKFKSRTRKIKTSEG